MSPGTDGRGDITEVLITSPRGINSELKPPMDGKGGEWDQTVGLHKQMGSTSPPPFLSPLVLTVSLCN